MPKEPSKRNVNLDNLGWFSRNRSRETDAMPKEPSKGNVIFDDLFSPDDGLPRRWWWWVFIAPGKIVLWIEYMFPERISGVFGSARRKKSIIIQIWYSITVYLAILIACFMLFAA